VSRLSAKCTNFEVLVSPRNFNQASVSEGYGLDYITENNLV